MKEKPILFSGEMVRAILEGRKTQTRRIIIDLPCDHPEGLRSTEPRQFEGNENWYLPTAKGWMRFYCNPGDQLWVRETWSASTNMAYKAKPERGDRVWYKANNDRPSWATGNWKPSIFMPRWASRITLCVTDVRVERLWQLSEYDMNREGVASPADGHWVTPFKNLWNRLHPDGFDWDANPFVWVVEFEATW